MKLRIRRNSIRLRLQISEIEQLSENGIVTESVGFSSKQKLVYSIETDESLEKISVSSQANKIKIQVPLKIAEDWCKTDKVSLEAAQRIDQDSSLKLLLEKDFKCLTRRKGEGDMFPNPNEPH